MKVFSLPKRLTAYVREHNIEKAFKKQKTFLEIDPFHPSLHTKTLEPKHLKIYSFRVTKKYRAIFVYCRKSAIEIIDINNHYQ